MIDEITPLIITYNEAPNIARVLDKLRWAKRIVVIDSGSNDGTQEIVARYTQVELITRAFDSFADQCNFGIKQIRTRWLLSLDADYELSESLIEELSTLKEDPAVAGYKAPFTYRIYGHALRGTLYPPRAVLYRGDCAHYVNEGHEHRVKITGTVRDLRGRIFHDDRKALSRWFASQQKYAFAEARYLLNAETPRLSGTDKIRLMGWPAPIIVLFYVLIVKGCLFEGWPGWFYALQRLLAETMIALQILELKYFSKQE